MQHMQAMHDQMMAAKSPAERQALMADHMKAMQEGMDAMQYMAGAGKESDGMGTMRMDMMTMMMQMMMDRQQMGARGMGGMDGGMGATPHASPPPAKPTQ
jgi:hypothetical protein